MPIYLVDTISTFRLRYAIEAKSLEHAYDEIVMNDSPEFSQEFNTEQLCRITKLSGLSGNIQVYPGKPIRFSSNIGNLGKISIYIKSKDQIENEQCNIESDGYESD